MDKKKLGAIKLALQKRIVVEKLYLFGSRARGTFHNDSDYDVAVVSPSFEKMTFDERQHLVRTIVRSVLGVVPLDVICYTPEEFRKGRTAFLPSIIEEEGIAV